MSKYLLGIDNGGTFSKAAIFTLDGKEVAVGSRQTELITPRPNYVERDMTKMWQATAEAIREVVTKSAVDPADIVCIACTGHGNGVYLTDKDGNPTRNAIMSSDGRAREYIEKWTADGVDKSVRPKTMQCIWPAQPNALLAWIRDNEPDVLKKSAYVFMAKDYIRYCLTGEAYAELTDMSGTSLMNVGTGDYDADVLDAFGIGQMQRLLPPLKRSADICGQITAKVAELTGLKQGTPVAGGMFDIDACGLSSGITDESQLCIVVGTWGNNQYISEKPVVDGVFDARRKRNVSGKSRMVREPFFAGGKNNGKTAGSIGLRYLQRAGRGNYSQRVQNYFSALPLRLKCRYGRQIISGRHGKPPRQRRRTACNLRRRCFCPHDTHGQPQEFPCHARDDPPDRRCLPKRSMDADVRRLFGCSG